MSELLITSDGTRWDIALVDGEGVDTSEQGMLVEVTQRVVYRLLSWLGESVYDVTAGLPYEQGIFGESEIDGISGLFYLEVIQTEGVDEIIEWDVVLEDRTLRITFSIRVGASLSDVTELEITP